MPFGLRTAGAGRGGFLTESPQSQADLAALKKEQARSDVAIQRATEKTATAAQEVAQASQGIPGLTQEYLGALKPIGEFQPRQIDQQQLMSFAGVATALAALAAKGVRGDITVGLAAAAGALKGYSQGNIQQARLELVQFNTKMNSAIAQNRSLTDRYKAIIEDKNLTLQQKIQNHSVAAHEKSDTVAIALLREGRLREKLKRDDTITMGTNQIEAQMRALNFQAQMWDKRFNAMTEAAKIRAGAGGGAVGLSQDAIDNGAAYFLLNGRMPMGMARIGRGALEAIQNRAAEMTQKSGMTPEEFAAAGPITRQKLGALLQLEKMRNAVQAYEGMLDLNIDILKDLSKKVDRTDSPYANRPILWLQQNAAGDKDVAEYLFQVNTVSTEIARILQNPNLTGQLTDTGRKELQEVVSGTFNPKQMEAVLDRAQKDARNRSGMLDKQVNKVISEVRDPLHKSAGAAPGASALSPAEQQELDTLRKRFGR